MSGRRVARAGAFPAGLLLAVATLGAAPAAPEPPPPSRTVDGPFAAEIVALPPYELDAVEPPWAKDTRTAITTSVSLDSGAALTMADALRASPGVHVDQPGGPGGRSSLYLRGGEENYTVVLLDGVPANNPTDSRGGGFDFGTLDASEFAAAQIVRGPVSARYGPDALSGVIKLTSDVMGLQDGSSMGLEAGTHGQMAGHVATGARQHNLTTAASVHWSENGSRAAGDFARHEAVAAGATGQGPAVEWRMSLRYGWEDSAAFPDDSGGERLAVLRSLEERSGSTTTAAVELLSPAARATGIKWRVRSWGAWLHAHDNSPGVAPGLRDPIGLPASLEATTLRRGGFSVEGDVEAGGSGALAVGVDGESEQGRSDAVLVYGPFPIPAPFTASRDRVGTFAEYTWQPAAGWLVQPSVRLDKARDYSPRFTPRLGLKVPVGARTVLRVNAGTGFKLPSFYAVSNPLVGNPALRPEKAQTVDIGIEQPLAAGRGQLEIGGFSSRYRNGIDFDPGPPPRLVNRNEIRSDGMEAALRLRLGDSLELGGSVTYADVRSEPGGGRLRGRPRTEGAVRAQWRPVKRLAIKAALVAVGSVLDSSVPTGDVLLPEWRRLSLAGRYEVHRGVALTVGVENLLNARYEEAIGFPSPGVRLRGGIEARF